MTLDEAFRDYAAAHGAAAWRLAPSREHYLALAQWLATQARPGAVLVAGLNGAQGSGKSTLAALVRHLLGRALGQRTAVLSLDDFYLTRAQREHLAATVHPLLATRGVPGTHDVDLLQRTLAQLRERGAGAATRVPRFVKALDERAPEADWAAVEGPVDIVLLEGWCVGTPPQAPEALAAPVNALEAQEDPDGRWRGYVNAQLGGTYAALFAQLDRLVFLQAPGFEVVPLWRLQQESDNVAAAGGAAPAMTPAQAERFVAHYERLTRHALRALPARADAVLGLDALRGVIAARYR